MLFVDDLAVELVASSSSSSSFSSRQASNAAKPWSKRRVRPRSSQIVARVKSASKRRSWLTSTSAERPWAIRPPAIRSRGGRGDWWARPAAGCRAPAPAPDQRGPPRLAAGQPGGSPPDRAEVGHHRPRRIGIVKFAHARRDIVEGRRETGHVRLLRQISEARRRLDEARSLVGRDLPRRDPEEGRLARPIAPDDGDAIAGGDRQLGAVEKRRAA